MQLVNELAYISRFSLEQLLIWEYGLAFMDQRIYSDEGFRKAVERCAECPVMKECDVFKVMMNGGQAVVNCPRGRPNVI